MDPLISTSKSYMGPQQWACQLTHTWIPTHPSFLSPPADSEKSLSVLVDGSQPLGASFRSYAWRRYAGPQLQHLMQQSLDSGMDLSRGPMVAFYRDRGPLSDLYADRTLGTEDTYGDYRRRSAAAVLIPEGGVHGKAHDAKAQSDLLCSSLILSGAFKCIKCSKVRVETRLEGWIFKIITKKTCR